MYIKLYTIKYERLLTLILGGYDFAEFYMLCDVRAFMLVIFDQ
jgi:hypothetical protein